MNDEVTMKEESRLGMPLEIWRYKSCTAEVASSEFDKWATLYVIQSVDERKGHATHLLTEIKKHYEEKGFTFGGTVALNEIMKRIYEKLGVTEYDKE